MVGPQFLSKLLLKQISCCTPRFPFILTAQLHSLYVKESKILERSGVGNGNFGKVGVGVGYFTSNFAAVV